ncbi:unnamed protein product [Clonostachys rosea]|uniref:PRISE-like Rossmann-fold domain-containing protein n=1 Tax=Bionectria ochroleuca TaxID=29856 RepID=A0ABY6UKD6_BIOOC|nr:unnamed protein product [Clonostachys rosea]
MPSAIVTGATGILGREITLELCSHPEQWDRIYTVSRSNTEDFGPRVKHAHLDLTGKPEDMARNLEGVQAEYVFFAAYLQKDSEDEATRVNGDMLASFLKALEINGVHTKIKRIILVCGAKNYGVHLGAVKIPMEETDPWMPEPPFPKNFYYRQQRILHEFCETHHTEWAVTYSTEVLGFARGNFMNLASAIGIYAAVSKELGDELVWPGSTEFYTAVTVFTDAKLHAQFCNWVALEPKAANEAFNITNGDADSWMNLWPRVAIYFGLRVPADQFSRPTPLASEKPLAPQPPLSLQADAAGLAGRTSQSFVRQRVDLQKWSQTKEVREAWKVMVEKDGLDAKALEKASWAFAGFAWGRDYSQIISMSKARKLGWTGYQDNWENLERTLGELRHSKVIP